MIRAITSRWDRFFFSRTGDGFGGVFRILFAGLCFLNMGLLGLDLELFYTESGYMPLEASRTLVTATRFSLFWILPPTDAVVWTVYSVMMLQILLLGLGVLPRLQAIAVFFWLATFQNRHMILFDGEDTVFRLLAFFVIFLPLHRYSVLQRFRRHKTGDGTWPIWPFRLIQFQMCLIFVSTALLKLDGPEWWDGTAMYYVIHIDDMYGKLNPPLLFNYLLPLKLMTWGTLVIEIVAPLTIWFRKTRKVTLIALILFHLGVDLSMNLNLFHWIMILGWLSFLARPLAFDQGRARLESDPEEEPEAGIEPSTA